LKENKITFALVNCKFKNTKKNMRIYVELLDLKERRKFDLNSYKFKTIFFLIIRLAIVKFIKLFIINITCLYSSIKIVISGWFSVIRGHLVANQGYKGEIDSKKKVDEGKKDQPYAQKKINWYLNCWSAANIAAKLSDLNLLQAISIDFKGQRKPQEIYNRAIAKVQL
jgi:hypothetical protein